MLKSSLLVTSLAAALAFGLAPSPSATASISTCDDESGLCVDSGGAKWSDGKSSSKKDRNKRSKKNGGTLSLSIDGGRGSVFLNGRFVGTAPVSGVAIPSGNNDLHVRDGATILANGLLKVPKTSDIALTVRHD